MAKKNIALDRRILKAREKGMTYREIAKKENRALITIYERHQKIIFARARELNSGKGVDSAME